MKYVWVTKYVYLTVLLIICSLGCATTEYLFEKPKESTMAYRQFDNALKDQEGEFHATGEFKTLDSYKGRRVASLKVLPS